MTKVPISLDNYFQGRRLLISRILWIILFVVSVVILIVFVINFYAAEYKWSQPCNLMPTEEQVKCSLTQQAYHQLGIPLGFRSIYFSIGVVIQVSSWILVGLLIFLKRGHKPFEFFFSLMLVVSGTLTLDPTIPSGLRTAYPVISPLLYIMELLGGVLMVVWYLFPDGNFAPRWMRWVAVFFVASNLRPIFIPDSLWPAVLSMLTVIGTVLTFIFTFVYRYYKISNSLQRQQIKWVTASLSIFMGVAIVWELHYFISPSSAEPGISQVLWSLSAASLFFLTRALIAASIAIAIFRYHLWDIDFIINRSLVYGTLTVLLIGIFGGSLLLVSSFVQGQSFVIAFGITALIAGMLFNPTRHRLQRFVDQHLYNIQINYQKTRPPRPTLNNDIVRALQQTHFGTYQNLEWIGRGRMADVYKSIHPTLGVPVAIKILPDDLASDPNFCQRFMREAEAISKLDHPDIVHIYDHGKHNGTYYIVMEYLAGKDLDDFLKESGRLSLAQALPILWNIASALDYAHQHGVVHRDVKPSNIMLDRSANIRPVLSDFGLAKIVGGNTALTQAGTLGTCDYIAPEQIRASAEVDNRADIYALGVMTYQMLTGELPFKRDNQGALLFAHINHPPPNASELVTDLPWEVADAIRRAMAKKPDERFTTATEFWEKISANEF